MYGSCFYVILHVIQNMFFDTIYGKIEESIAIYPTSISKIYCIKFSNSSSSTASPRITGDG